MEPPGDQIGGSFSITKGRPIPESNSTGAIMGIPAVPFTSPVIFKARAGGIRKQMVIHERLLMRRPGRWCLALRVLPKRNLLAV